MIVHPCVFLKRNFMKHSFISLFACLIFLILGIEPSFAKVSDNQTDTLSPVLPPTGLPFRVIIEKANFQLPVGFHSGVVGVYKGLWILIAGRTNGLHGFDATNNFPPDAQNTNIYVVNSITGSVASRALNDPTSGLTQQQIDTLSVTSPEGFQEGDTLYMAGGYGVDTTTGAFGTKAVFTAIYLPGIVEWVTQPGNKGQSIAKNIRQVYNPIFQITGGAMFKLGNVIQLVFGQNFDGQYTDGSNGTYSRQVRQFRLKNVGGNLSVDVLSSMPSSPDPNFRRRDLNVLPALLNNNNKLQYGLIAYAGVFTLATGVWTVPVIINGVNDPMMPNPNLPTTFKQAMNQYICAAAALYSRKYTSMYHLFFGGISFGFFQNGTFQTDNEIPFINQITTIKKDKNNQFTQYLMDAQYPLIRSTGSNPGNPLLFGAGATFIPNNILQYPNSVISLDTIRRPTVIGYIVGGIQSTLANTNVITDSSASPFVFKVTLVPTANLAAQAKLSKVPSSAHAKRQGQQIFQEAAYSLRKYNRKYHESVSPPIRQLRHSV